MKKLTIPAIAMTVAMSAGVALADHHKGDWEEKFRAADTNGDGVVSREEFHAAFPDKGEERFAKIDANGDGVITLEEKKAHKEQKKEKKDR